MAINVDERVSLRDSSAKLRHLRMRHEAMKNERKAYVGYWRELSEYILPTRGRYYLSDRDTSQKRHNKIINNVATQAARTLAAGMMAGITSPARPWFKLSTPDPQLVEFGPVRTWLHFIERLMREVFNQSNLYHSLHTLYLELGVFNTACMLIDEDFDDVIRCYTMTAGEYSLGMSQRLNANALSREYSLTAWQVVERFGLENCSQRVRTAYERGKYDEWVDVVHIIQPKIDYKPGARGVRGFAFSSDYFEVAQDNEVDKSRFLRESGYDLFPVLAPRWDVRGSDVYGNGPGQEVLGDIKQLQQQELRKAQGIDKMVNPPMVADPKLRNQGTSTLPGGITFADGLGTQPAFRPAYQINLPLGELRVDMQAVETRIKQAFYYDLFRMMLESDRRQITAREVEEKHEEKLLMLGPVLERLHNELLDPLIDITFQRMVKADMVPPPPKELEGMELKVEYISILAQAQRAVGIGSLERFTGYVMNLAQIKPDIIDKVDFDQAVEEHGTMLGIPPDVILSDDVVEQRRGARAEAEAQAVQAQQAQMAADTANKLGNTPMADDSALQRILNPVA